MQYTKVLINSTDFIPFGTMISVILQRHFTLYGIIISFNLQQLAKAHFRILMRLSVKVAYSNVILYEKVLFSEISLYSEQLFEFPI